MGWIIVYRAFGKIFVAFFQKKLNQRLITTSSFYFWNFFIWMCYRHIDWTCICNGWKFSTRKSTSFSTRTWYGSSRWYWKKGNSVFFSCLNMYSIQREFFLAPIDYWCTSLESKYITRSCVVYVIEFKGCSSSYIDLLWVT